MDATHPTVIVVGSANMDFTVTVDRLPVPGETVLGRDVYHCVGGKGANQAVAARRAGAKVALLTKLGRDPNGRLIEQHLTALGLPREGLMSHPTSPTGAAVIMVDQAGRNMIAVAPGSNQTLTAEEIRRASSLIKGGTVLLAQLEVPLAAVVEALAIAKAHGLTTILNPAPACPLAPEILSLVDVLTPNEGEAQALTGKAEVSEAASALIQQGVRSVLITLAERGALLQQAGTSRLFPAYPVKAVDSTAAGDAFNGALACALAEGRSLEAAIRFANAAGALTTTKRGAQDALPTRGEIEQVCNQLD